MQSVKADFDRIALLEDEGSNSNDFYHSFLLGELPPRCDSALEIGCGTGAFSRLLAERSKRVVALDLSPNMVGVARERSKQFRNIDFQVADAMTAELPSDEFDCIVSIATLHHMPTEPMLFKIKRALKANGTLAIFDLFEGEGFRDLAASALALPTAVLIRLVRCGRLRPPRQVREAWAEHGRNDKYLTVSEARRIYEEILPGAKVRKHLLWRYSAIWHKPEATKDRFL
jgi:ubiquinone/menaquinone biosynthesis C-methylase UbiE